MTYLDAVNNILRRLREREVVTVSATPYSALIGDLVNDAKREVEDAWDWTHMRSTITATTVAGTFSYALTDTDQRMEVHQVLDDTSNMPLKYMASEPLTEKYLLGGDISGPPEFYSFNGIDSNGDTVVDLYPNPDGVYDVRFNGVLRTADLSADTDEFLAPSQPILLLAWAKAIEERGEDAGVMSSSAYATAQRSLADHVSLDAQRTPEELIWTTI